jgi:hypothetical protein
VDPENFMTRSSPTARTTLAVATALSLAIAAPSQAQTQTALAATFCNMKEISVPIVDAGRVDGVLRVTLVLEARDAIGVAELDRRMPELRAAALAEAIEFARLYASPFTPVDARKLAASLTPALRRVSPSIKRVLIVKVAAQMA